VSLKIFLIYQSYLISNVNDMTVFQIVELGLQAYKGHKTAYYFVCICWRELCATVTCFEALAAAWL